MKIVFLIIAILLLSLKSVSGDELKPTNMRCGAFSERSFVSVSVVEKKGGKSATNLARIKRKIVSPSEMFSVEGHPQAVLRLIEIASNTESAERKSKIRELRNYIDINDECEPEKSVDIKDVAIFGFPPIFFASDDEAGARRRREIIMNTEFGEVPITISYKLERFDRLLNNNVALVSFMFTGTESAGKKKKKWAGMGFELLDTKERVPIIRIMEIKRGSSFIGDVDLKISYSESIIF